MRNLLMLIGLAITCTACAPDPSINNVSNSPSLLGYQDNDIGYEISFPSQITESGSWMDADTRDRGPFFGSENIRENNPPFGWREISIRIYDDSLSCDISKLGAHENDWSTRMQDETSIHWGKVTFWYNGIPEGMEETPSRKCIPPNYNTSEWRERKPDQFAAYALCSEKDGKRVVVCVQQMTDNPDLAEEIFSTFQWLDE